MADEKKKPQRTPAEIAADIAAEREQLVAAFDSLGGELQQKVVATVEQAKAVGRKAIIVVPAVAAGVGAVLAAAALMRRRRDDD